MPQFADLVVYNPDEQIVLIIEVKNRIETSRTWATQTRRNMLAHGMMPNSPYLLLALPDMFYLWKDAGNRPELVEPSYEIDAYPFLQPYYEKAHISPDEIKGYAFELIITSWLNEFIHWGIPETVPEETRELLEDSGLREALKGGKVVIQVPA